MAKCPVNLWRALHSDDFPEGPMVAGEAAAGVLYPAFERKPIRPLVGDKQRYRDPDVEVLDGLVQTGGGTSLYDRDNFFKGKNWRYFRVPKDTEVDPRLSITGPKPNDFFKANHYQIEAAEPVFVAVFKGALDNLARAAVAKACADARR